MTDTVLQKSYREKAAAQQNALTPALVQTMTGVMPQLPELLPLDIPVEQFRAALYLELSGRPALATCTQTSLRDAVIKAAMYGLLPGRDCHILPFKNRKGGNTQATFVPNYFGICLALERTGKVKRAFAHPVYEGDEFELDYFADQYHHIPHAVLKREAGTIRFYYGAVLLTNGTAHVEVMTLEQIDAVRRRAPAHDEGPWVTDTVEMSRKTALKRCAKFVRLTPQLREMFEGDEARELDDIPPERHARNIADLYGEGPEPTAAQEEAPGLEPPPDSDQPGKRGGESLRTAIDAMHRAAGKDEWEIVSYWGRICREKGVQAPEELPLSLLSKLLGDVRRFYGGQEGEEFPPSQEEREVTDATE